VVVAAAAAAAAAARLENGDAVRPSSKQMLD